MTSEPEFLLLTANAGRRPRWLSVWLTLIAIGTGAVLLCLGLVLALAALVAMFLALLPVWARRLFASPQYAGGPVTIEGDYTMATQSSEAATDQAPVHRSSDDAQRRERPWQ